MSMWRCPHCGTPQAESSRCWVCRRSSTTCSTCRNYRRSVAGQLGYCGLDRRRLPLAGTELRGCWDAGPSQTVEPTPGAAVRPNLRREGVRLRDFIPVELVGDTHQVAAEAQPAVAGQRLVGEARPAVADQPSIPTRATTSGRDPIWGDRVTLFGELDT